MAPENPGSAKGFWLRAICWWGATFIWALFAYSTRLWVLPVHLLVVFFLARRERPGWPVGAFYGLFMAAHFYGMTAMLWSIGMDAFIPSLLLAVAVMLGVRKWVWSSGKAAVLTSLFNVFGLVFLFRFYGAEHPEMAGWIDAQPGVEVVFLAQSSPALGASPRSAMETCDGHGLWVGTGRKPLLSRFELRTRNALSVLSGKAADLLAEDCRNGLLFVGLNTEGEILVLDNRTLDVLFRSGPLGGQVSYVAQDLKGQRVFFGEDVGLRLWTLSYRGRGHFSVERRTPGVWDVMWARDSLVVAGKGWLKVLDGKTLEPLRTAFLPVPIQPQLAWDEKNQTVLVTDLLGGRILRYRFQDLEQVSSLWTGWGVRYAWVSPTTGHVWTANYFSGELGVWDQETGAKLKSLNVGPQPRAMAASRDDRRVYVATQAGLMKLEAGVVDP